MKTKKMKNRFFTILAIVAVMVFTACSNNDDNAAPEENLSEIVMQDFVEDFQALSVPTGLSSSNNKYAQQANAQFETLKGLGSGFASLFIIPANAVSSKSTIKTASKTNALATKTYIWSSNGTTVTYNITDASDRYSFTYSIESTDFTGKFMDGYQLKDGSYAEVSLYVDNQTISTIKWWVTASTTKMELDSDGYKLTLESNTADNSGTLKVYDDNFLAALYQWNANGSGTYTDYYTDESFSW